MKFMFVRAPCFVNYFISSLIFINFYNDLKLALSLLYQICSNELRFESPEARREQPSKTHHKSAKATG